MSEREAGQPARTRSGPPPTAPPGALPPPAYPLGIGSISDVVFGLALSIGSLILISQTPSTGHALALGIFYFGFSFLAVILVWLAFRRITVVLPYETQAPLTVNVALLFCVAIEPFLFYVSVAGTGTSVGGPASMALALDVGVMMLLLAAFYFLLEAEDRKVSHRPVDPGILRQLWVGSVGRVVVGTVFLVSALPLFDSPGPLGSTVREDIWIVALGLFFVVQYGAPLITRTARSLES